MPGGSRLGDISRCKYDSHGCSACPHDVRGPAVQSSGDVTIDAKPALRQGDGGIHMPCCRSNRWAVKSGASTVIINGKPAARHNDPTLHCGGPGKIIDGSSSVIIGNGVAQAFGRAAITGAPVVQDPVWDQHIAEKSAKLPESLPAEKNPSWINLKSQLREYIHERGVQNYQEGHEVAAFIDAIGEGLIADLPESVAGVIGQVAFDYMGGKLVRIPAKGLKLLWAHADDLAAPLQKKVKSALRKLESGKQLNQTETNHLTEALGEIGGQKAVQRQGLTGDPQFVRRYHGPDYMGRDGTGKLTEVEFKGSQMDTNRIATHTDGKKQLSHLSNKKKGLKMASKTKKVGLPSNRIGGPYTSNEMDFWESVFENDGQKGLMSSHTNVSTGEVKVFNRDAKGNILGDGPIDTFNLYD